ncbi:pyridoxal-phosphate dependent enzyme [Psychrosphaera sp. 1_MG-2023]|uniref:1-aminocyclopropane-1-carboxylate deaminase/D-cysteine desulfhydrase n=1 Tax=Psychrosphaera sp. 1_MG-2023 TaxID=3062643 RepID=UPI0026E2FC52|nr:pyridoxal-phosphate dependent enzyme [Psychrosphaera sp. 1_MG-2023]MDO6718104.1 pyridoxal-phosphate dependent enzyme [Psychrosphaera sp. 1_MG-2023]
MNTDFFNFQPVTPVQQVSYQRSDKKKLTFLVKRDDLIHPLVSGNKWRKLKYNLNLAQNANFAGIASFGGAFSNHIAALSALGHQAEFPTIGFIRTDHIDSKNPTLRLAKDRGMTLIKLTRQEYRLRNDPGFITSLKVQYPDYLFVPEGGSNEAAGAGLKELADEISQQCEFDRFAVAVGSGGTVSGLMDNLPHNGIGVAVVRDDTLITNLTKKYGNRLTLKYNPISGKYGKVTPELAEFCLDFFTQTGIPVEPIYTGKLLFNLCLHREYLNIPDDEKILVIHTGGLQGISGLIYRQKISASDWISVIEATAN